MHGGVFWASTLNFRLPPPRLLSPSQRHSKLSGIEAKNFRIEGFVISIRRVCTRRIKRIEEKAANRDRARVMFIVGLRLTVASQAHKSVHFRLFFTHLHPFVRRELGHLHLINSRYIFGATWSFDHIGLQPPSSILHPYSEELGRFWSAIVN